MPLYLLPNLLGPVLDHTLFLPRSVDAAVPTLDGLIAEDAKEGRAYLKRFTLKKPLPEIPVHLLNEHTPPAEITHLLEPLLRGEHWGLVSDAGLPCLADPGAALVRAAKLKKIPVVAFPGPCSITLALMLSGLPGQRFAFHGYPPKDPLARKKALQQWEQQAPHQTQIFMEPPYRNPALFTLCTEILKPETLMCIATDLTLPEEDVVTLTIKEWRQREAPAIHKRPSLFLLG